MAKTRRSPTEAMSKEDEQQFIRGDQKPVPAAGEGKSPASAPGAGGLDRDTLPPLDPSEPLKAHTARVPIELIERLHDLSHSRRKQGHPVRSLQDLTRHALELYLAENGHQREGL